MAIVLALAAVVLWAVFLSNYPPIHDAFHELRHSMYVIPCH
jgi:cobalt transporter subunit CbtB